MSGNVEIVLTSISTGIAVAGVLSAMGRFYIKTIVSDEVKKLIQMHLRESHWSDRSSWRPQYPMYMPQEGRDDSR